MSKTDIELLSSTIKKQWKSSKSPKVDRYVGQFTNKTRFGTRISGKVLGNHGTYSVSLWLDDNHNINSGCSCYIGKHGGCHHCVALAITFLKNTQDFTELKKKTLGRVKTVEHLPDYLRGITLDELIDKLKKQGITQKAFAEGIGMSSQKLSAIKSSERRNRYFHELGAVKLACMWTLEKFKK